MSTKWTQFLHLAWQGGRFAPPARPSVTPLLMSALLMNVTNILLTNRAFVLRHFKACQWRHNDDVSLRRIRISATFKQDFDLQRRRTPRQPGDTPQLPPICVPRRTGVKQGQLQRACPHQSLPRWWEEPGVLTGVWQGQQESGYRFQRIGLQSGLSRCTGSFREFNNVVPDLQHWALCKSSR